MKRSATARCSAWDEATLRTRIVDTERRLRRAASSPNAEEIEVFRRILEAGGPTETVLVLGMTPELRRLALQHARRVYSVDDSKTSIDLFRSWVDRADRRRERIIRANWLGRNGAPPEKVDAVLGDGVFAMLPDVDAHCRLLRRLRRALRPNGRLVVRMCVIPSELDAAAHRLSTLVERYRHGDLDAAEFGHGARILGFLREHYDAGRSILDNQGVYAACERALRDGGLTRPEYDVIRSYYYGGPNCIVSQAAWEGLLRDAGYSFRAHPLSGKLWYRYFIVYSCRPLSGTGSGG